MPTRLLPALSVLVLAGSAAAQTTRTAPDSSLPTIDELPPLVEVPPRPRTGKVRYSLQAGTAYQTGDPDLDVFRGDVSINASMALNSDVDVSMSLGYAFDNYNFERDAKPAGDLWDQIHTYSARMSFDFKVNTDWTIFAGPVFQVSGESTDFDDSWIGGGFGGLVYSGGRGLTLGVGVGITSQLQDSARIFPVVILDWEITNNLRLTSRSSVRYNGISLVMDLTENLDLSLGVGFLNKRFRLDDDNPAAGGVGEEKATPILLSAIYTLTPTATISAYAGVVSGGEITVENDDGGKDDTDYDLSIMVGVSARLTF